MSSIIVSIKDLVTSIFEVVFSLFHSAFSLVRGVFTTAIDFATSVLNLVLDTVKGTLEAAGGVGKFVIGRPYYPLHNYEANHSKAIYSPLLSLPLELLDICTINALKGVRSRLEIRSWIRWRIRRSYFRPIAEIIGLCLLWCPLNKTRVSALGRLKLNNWICLLFFASNVNYFFFSQTSKDYT